MSDFTETRGGNIDSQYSVNQAMEALSGWLASTYGVSEPPSPAGTVDLGSRFSYRMRGAIWGRVRVKMNKLPLSFTWTVTEKQPGTSIAIDLRSNEGRYLIRTYQHHLIYERRFDEMMTELETLLR